MFLRGYDSIFLWVCRLQRKMNLQPFEENYFYRNFSLGDATQLDGTGDFLTGGLPVSCPPSSVSASGVLCFPRIPSAVVHSNQKRGRCRARAFRQRGPMGYLRRGPRLTAGNLVRKSAWRSNGTPNQAVVASSFHNLFGLSLQSVKYPQMPGTSGTFATAHPGDTPWWLSSLPQPLWAEPPIRQISANLGHLRHLRHGAPRRYDYEQRIRQLFL